MLFGDQKAFVDPSYEQRNSPEIRYHISHLQN